MGSKGRSVKGGALSPVHGRILSNLFLPHEKFSILATNLRRLRMRVRYRGGGAGERGGNCFGVQHCVISIIIAVDLIRPRILQRLSLRAFTTVKFHSNKGSLHVCVRVRQTESVGFVMGWQLT